MPTCPAKTVFSPDRAAAEFVRLFPKFAGVLDVRSTAPAGKAGRYLKDKTTRFFCASGFVRKTLMRRLKLSTRAVRAESYRNGVCPVCGQVLLAALIGWAFDRTGLSVEACPTCLARHALRPDCTRYLTGPVSPLAVHDLYRLDVTVDIRAVQAGYNVDWTITWAPAASEPLQEGPEFSRSPAAQVSVAQSVP